MSANVQNKQILSNLVDLAHEKSSEGRRELLRSVTDLFLETPQGLSSNEVGLFGDVIGDLVHDMEIEVRAGLAEQLSLSPEAPQNVIIMLANDQLEVARPVLENSPVLRNETLLKIIKHRSQEHKLAVAVRKEIDSDVSDALAQEGDDNVLVALVNNPGAELSVKTMGIVVKKSEYNEKLQRPLVSRQDLPPELLQEMFWWVSNTLRERILSTTENVNPDELNQYFDSIGKSISRGKNPNANNDSPAQKFIRRKVVLGQLNESFLLETLRSGQIPEFIVGFSHLAEIDIKTSRRIILDPGCEPLAVACKACGFDRSTFATIEMLTYNGAARSTNQVFELLEIYDRIGIESAKRAMRFWRVRMKALESNTYWPPRGTDYDKTNFLKTVEATEQAR